MLTCTRHIKKKNAKKLSNVFQKYIVLLNMFWNKSKRKNKLNFNPIQTNEPDKFPKFTTWI